MTVMRTEYVNLSTGTVRSGPTGHGESLTDVESYLLPLERARGSGLYSFGVVAGLQVSATTGQPGVTVSVGTALDASGRLVVLAAEGAAVVDPDVDPDELVNVPTVTVPTGGVMVGTAGLSGERLVTVSWREVVSQGVVANAPVLVHAPWLRLQPVAGFQDVGAQVVLARVVLDGDGRVTGLTGQGRRLAGVVAGRVALRVPRPMGAGAVAVEDAAAAELGAREDGGVELRLLAGGQARPVLSVEPTGTVVAAGAVQVKGPSGGRTYGISSGADGSWHFADATAQADRLVIDPAGNVGVGVAAGQAQRTLHVEGLEVHSGGGVGGFSFADRTVGRFVNVPTVGERWVWYSSGGSARLWSRTDRLTVSAKGEGGGLDVARRMRVRQGGDASAGIWFMQDGVPVEFVGHAFVGMSDNDHVGFFGNPVGWGLRVNRNSGEVKFSGNYGQPEGASTLSLFGSRIGDVGGGVLFLRSGGGVVAFDGNDAIGIGTGAPRSRLHVEGGTLLNGPVEIRGGMSFNGGLGINGGVGINGALRVSGSLSKGGGGFKIDHPLDPANKYLSHSFVESPEMLNVYTGTVVTDEQGEATVGLPGFFEALNRDPRFQVTPLGQLALATVDGGVRDGRFTIRTDKPGVTVSWQVTGVRQDPWAEAHPVVVEEPKPTAERGLFLHPEVHGQSPEMSVMGYRDGTGTTAREGG
jgi:hypothetical protein